MKTLSTRKPHNDLAGYVCELKSKHPKLPGHFVILDNKKGASFDGNRYGVFHINGDRAGGMVCFTSLPNARHLMKEMAAGSDVADFGQHATDDSRHF